MTYLYSGADSDLAGLSGKTGTIVAGSSGGVLFKDNSGNLFNFTSPNLAKLYPAGSSVTASEDVLSPAGAAVSSSGAPSLASISSGVTGPATESPAAFFWNPNALHNQITPDLPSTPNIFANIFHLHEKPSNSISAQGKSLIPGASSPSSSSGAASTSPSSVSSSPLAPGTTVGPVATDAHGNIGIKNAAGQFYYFTSPDIAHLYPVGSGITVSNDYLSPTEVSGYADDGLAGPSGGITGTVVQDASGQYGVADSKGNIWYYGSNPPANIMPGQLDTINQPAKAVIRNTSVSWPAAIQAYEARVASRGYVISPYDEGLSGITDEIKGLYEKHREAFQIGAAVLGAIALFSFLPGGRKR